MSVSKLFVKKLALVASFGMAATLLSGEHAEAATDVTTFQVDVVVNSFCNILANPVAFSTAYDPSAVVALDTGAGDGTSGAISVNCTLNVPFNFEFNGGLNPLATAAGNRAMAGSNGGLLGYQLQLAGANTDLAIAATIASGVGDGYETVMPFTGLQTWTIDGVIPPSQGVPGGNFSDTVTATLNY